LENNKRKQTALFVNDFKTDLEKIEKIDG